jgi:hypothetical protein
MSDDEIRRLIREDLNALSSSPSSARFWKSLADLLEENGDEESPEEQLLKTLLGHSKILIRQNELILRAVSRKAPPPSE